MKLQAPSALALAALLTATAGIAQTKAPEPDFTLAYNVGVTSDYRFRGVAQTASKPALQAGLDLAHKNGYYLGLWGSNINWIKDYTGATDGSLEVDIYGGFKGEISKDFTFDLGLITYQYPRNTAPVDANTTEFYGALSYGPVTAKYSRSVSNFIANADSLGAVYLEVAATFDLGNGFSLTPHLGRQSIPNVANNAGDYTDYALTLGKDFGNGLTGSLAAIGTNANEAFYTDLNAKFLGNNALVVGVKYTF